MNTTTPALEALDLTHVLYDPSSNLALALALATLSPILITACYGALTVVTRDALIVNMWAGQMACEGFNGILKHFFKEDRPDGKLGAGYGFPSSHSQYMGYFSSFLILHLYLRHRFQPSGLPWLDNLWRVGVYAALAGLGIVVCYSRFYLSYHTPRQIVWGYIVGIILGILHYGVTEELPRRFPDSLLGRLRRWLLLSSVADWCRIKDSWAIWSDGGHEASFHHWKSLYIASAKRQKQA